MRDVAPRLRWIDVGPTEGWGYPAAATEQQYAHLFPAYSAAIYDWMNYTGGGGGSSIFVSAPKSQPVGIGLAFIDGRFRVACAAAAG
jgi:hypothetical protein